MGLPGLVTHAATFAGLAMTIAVISRHILDAVLRLIAGITAIMARDERSRAVRALDVLRLLRRDRRLPTRPGSGP